MHVPTRKGQAAAGCGVKAKRSKSGFSGSVLVPGSAMKGSGAHTAKADEMTLREFSRPRAKTVGSRLKALKVIGLFCCKIKINKYQMGFQRCFAGLYWFLPKSHLIAFHQSFTNAL
jgi:hypothetical protein